MTTIKVLTRHVTKRGKRVKEYRVQFRSKGRITFVTPQWYSRLKDVQNVTTNLMDDVRSGSWLDKQGLLV